MQTSARRVEFDADSLDRRDPALIRRVLPYLREVHRHYLRLEMYGVEHLPDGPALLAANHNGGIFGPDLSCTLQMLWQTQGPEAPIYALAHDFAMRQMPSLGRLLMRFGAIRACPENAERVLALGGRVLVYPGGDLDAYRHARLRDRVVLGERTGFVRVAQQTGAPIVPIVAHGAHRSAYIFHEGERLARLLGLSRWGRLARFPFALALPWGIAPGPWLPYLPLPFRITLAVLPPVYAARGDDPQRLREHVRTLMQRKLTQLAEARR